MQIPSSIAEPKTMCMREHVISRANRRQYGRILLLKFKQNTQQLFFLTPYICLISHRDEDKYVIQCCNVREQISPQVEEILQTSSWWLSKKYTPVFVNPRLKKKVIPICMYLQYIWSSKKPLFVLFLYYLSNN